MEKVGTFIVLVLILGTILCMVGRFTPGLSRVDGLLALSGGKVFNASGGVSYYYLQQCDKVTGHCQLKSLKERYEDMRTIYSLTSKRWYMERVGELVIDSVALASNIFGLLFAFTTCTSAVKRQRLSFLAATFLLISGTLQLTNLGILFSEIIAYEKSPQATSKLLFPYSLPLVIIGSVCLLLTSTIFYANLIHFLKRNEQPQPFEKAHDEKYTNVMNVATISKTGSDIRGTHTNNDDVAIYQKYTETTSL